MSASELSPKYNSKDIETKLYSRWEKSGFFRPASDRRGKDPKQPRYVIVIPPPNVTGILHMGHALNNTIQDILIRFNRMRGKDTLWIPGTDHAGIATQNVVEKKLAKEKKTRHDLGREAFLKEVWKWKEEYGSTITNQLRRLGASCDWSRERFTMDAGLSKAVREAFVTLYERGLIYQGNYIINWCPRCQTALSDEEAVHKEVQGGLYHIKYPIAGKGRKAEAIGEDHIVVATTRPETMLGDSAVAVHPEDTRYKHLIGKKLILPLIEREIPVIADEFVDPEFGTGMVKVTPAHDPNDFEMGRRHNLPQIKVMYPDGRINENGGDYCGMDRFDARKKIVADLEAQGLFVRRDTHSHSVGHCYRCNTVVEPYLSKQWFVRMKPLAEKALEAHRAGKTKFYPDRWTKVYTNWLEGIRDWCISRQIWWGHQIPVWYCGNCKTRDKGPETRDKRDGGVIVSRETPAKCPHCGSKDLQQDPDVLDTWFSSWLWPFSTLGWPEKTKDLKHFYPTSDLVTASEIIFFWVARMIMAGLEFMGEVPFSRIYIHGTVRAEGGMKMSKSLGNSIDPLEVIDEMGADALRYSLVMLSAQDVYLSREKFETGRNFTNKIWNAARFTLGTPSKSAGFNELLAYQSEPRTFGRGTEALSLPNRWILSRLEAAAQQAAAQIDSFNFSQAATDLYHFVWNDFCDWFIELSKPVLNSQESSEKAAAQSVLLYVLENILRLLHPFMPFITEEIWSHLPSPCPLPKGEGNSQELPLPSGERVGVRGETIMRTSWPPSNQYHDSQAEASIEILQKTVSAVRDLRAKLNIGPGEKLKAVLSSADPAVCEIVSRYQSEIKSLGRLESLDVQSGFKKSKSYVGTPFANFEVFVLIEGVIDFVRERERIQKKITETEKYIDGLRSKLASQNFVQNAPREIIEGQREKLSEAQLVLQSHRELLTLFL